MPAGKLDLLIEQGATFKHALIVKQGGTSAPPADLTGFTARMQIRTDVEAATAIIELTTENGRISITPMDGRLDLLIDADDTAALSFESGVHDLELVSAGGEVTRLVQGKVKLSREVTR